MLWNGGLSFGGVIAFIFADLIVLPILDIYRKYYGWRMALFLFATFYAAMAAAALTVDLLLDPARLIPAERDAKVVEANVSWNYTTFLSPVFLALAIVLIWRSVCEGGWAMVGSMKSWRPSTADLA